KRKQPELRLEPGMTKRTDTPATARRTSTPARRKRTAAADNPRTGREIAHLAMVAAQAATVRALARQHREARAGLDRLMIAAYRAGVKVTHLAEAAQFSRDTVHDAVRPWSSKRKKDTIRDQRDDAPGIGRRSTRP